MKLTVTETQVVSAKSGKGTTNAVNPFGAVSREGESKRKGRLARIMSRMPVIIRLECLLSLVMGELGETGAELLAAGFSLKEALTQFTLGGIDFSPVNSDVRLGNVPAWGCMACSSATGSGYFNSQDANPKLLAASQWYFDPATRTLFTISPTCWLKYFAVEYGSRFVSLSEYRALIAKAEADAKAKAEADAALEAKAKAEANEVAEAGANAAKAQAKADRKGGKQ